jgi:hypothetical protein
VRLKAHLVFLDETGFLMDPTVRRTWGLRAQTPLLRHRLRHWGKVSGIGAVTISPKRRRLGLYLHLYPKANVSQEAVICFLRDLRRHLRGPIVLVWDSWSVHRGQRVRLCLQGQSAIRVEWLPPYAPELNPMDKGWGWMKGHRLANHGLSQIEELTEAVADAHQVARERQDLLQGFVRATGLPIRL